MTSQDIPARASMSGPDGPAPDGPPLLRARNVEATGCARAAFTTRLGGVSRGRFAAFNLSDAVGDDTRAVADNRRRLARAWGCGPEQVVEAAQVHGKRVAVATPEAAGTVVPGVDGLITDAPGLRLIVYVADCVPLLVVDPDRPAVGALHSGWRGTASGAAPALLDAMGCAYGTRPGRVRAALGPAIGGCCYEVDAPVAAAMSQSPWWPAAARRTGAERWRLDLREAVRRQLVAVGVPEASIETVGTCTMCHPDLFFSYRRDRTTGRMVGCIAADSRG